MLEDKETFSLIPFGYSFWLLASNKKKLEIGRAWKQGKKMVASIMVLLLQMLLYF